MITGIVRNISAVWFAYDKTYQLTSESGQYQTNSYGANSASRGVTNTFAYDSAGNRLMSVGAASAPRSYRHTGDNQLTGIFWNANTVTLGGEIQQAWTVLWVRVQQQGTNKYTTASLVCNRGQAVQWQVSDLSVIGLGSITFTVSVAAVKCTNSVGPGIQVWTNSTTVAYTRTSSGVGSITYAYDANGNRTNKICCDNNVVTNYTQYAYDVDNQLTNIICWTNDVAHANSPAPYFTNSYEYDVFGRRTKATEDGVPRYFVYDGLDVVVELNNSGAVTKRYVRGIGLGGGIGDIIAEVSASATNYYSYNHRGDVVTVTRPDGLLTNRFEYDAFGSPVTCNLLPVTCFTGFSSKEFDSRSGLSYYGYRFYDSQSGRWMNNDPLFWEADINLDRFIGNTPVRRVDYYGLWATEAHASFGGLINSRYPNEVDYKAGDTAYAGFSQFSLGHLWPSVDGANKAADNAVCNCDIHAFEMALHFVQDYYGHARKGFSWATYTGDVLHDAATLSWLTDPIGVFRKVLTARSSGSRLLAVISPKASERMDDHDVLEGTQTKLINDELQINWPVLTKDRDWMDAQNATLGFEVKFTNTCARTNYRSWHTK